MSDCVAYGTNHSPEKGDGEDLYEDMKSGENHVNSGEAYEDMKSGDGHVNSGEVYEDMNSKSRDVNIYDDIMK